MKKETEQKNKLYVGIFVLIISIYFSTLIHEAGHAIYIVKSGCLIPELYVSPFVIGFTDCAYPSDYHTISSTLSDFNVIALASAGIIFVSLIGIILFVIYTKSKHIKSNYFLSLLFYFLSFNAISNSFLQSINSGDVSWIVERYGYNFQIYFYILAFFLGIILIYQLKNFKVLLKRVEPNLSKKITNKLSKIWIWFVLTYFFVVLIMVFIIHSVL